LASPPEVSLGKQDHVKPDMAAARLLVSHGLADTGNPCSGLVRCEESSASLRKMLLEYKDVIMYDKGDKMIH
jgi:hypothetical protein